MHESESGAGTQCFDGGGSDIQMSLARKNILFISYTHECTGPTRSLLLLLDGLREWFEVAVLMPESGWLTEELLERRIRHYSVSRITKFTLPQIRRVVRRGDFDLVYANTHDRTSRIAFAAARLAGARYVCHVRAMGWDGSTWRFGHLRFADGVVAVSDAAGESIRRFSGSRRLHVVHNGVDIDRLAGDSRRTDLRCELGWSDESQVILSVGNICRRKGQAHAVICFRSVLERHANARLCLVGRLDREPAYTEQIRDQVSRFDLEEKVVLLGFRPDTVPLLRNADVFLHTALADPHPRAVIEAMALGLPVAAFGVDGVAESVVDGVTGQLVPSGDSDALAAAVCDLLDHPDQSRRMGEAGCARARERFSHRVTAERVAAIIANILEE